MKNKLKTVGVVLLLLVSLIAGFKISDMLYQRKQPQITVAYIGEKIDAVSELTTAELEYKGLIMYSEGKIPFITQKKFSMGYSANIRAGVDASKIKIDITKEKVSITVPDAKIQSIDVNPDSIEFYDERHALFNWTSKEDTIDAIALAKEDVSAHANVDELIKRADEQTAALLESILKGSVGDRELIIQ